MNIAHFAVVVHEYDDAVDWYTTRLGFELLEDTDLGGGKRWVRVAPRGGAGSALLLARAVNPHQQSRIGNQAGGRVFLFLNTDDFRRDYNDFTARGVKFVREPANEPYGTVAVFEDLYGNLWDLIEPR